jgi:hypothetical protein
MLVEGQGFGPGDQFGGQSDDFEPDPIGLVVVEGQVAKAGVRQAADTVLGAGALAVADLKGRQRPARAAGVGRKAFPTSATGMERESWHVPSLHMTATPIRTQTPGGH